MALRANRTEQRRKAREQAARALAASSACRRPLVQPNGCLLGSRSSNTRSFRWLVPFLLAGVLGIVPEVTRLADPFHGRKEWLGFSSLRCTIK